jgi:hypothetical protein
MDARLSSRTEGFPCASGIWQSVRAQTIVQSLTFKLKSFMKFRICEKRHMDKVLDSKHNGS